MGSYEYLGSYVSNVLSQEQYRQHRVNIQAEIADTVRDRFIENEIDKKKAVFSGSALAHVFDLLVWEPLVEVDDGYCNDGEDQGWPKGITALNGMGNDATAAALRQGNRKLVQELMLNRLRYIGHPTGKWDSTTGQRNQSIGSQRLGIRPFWAWKATPLHSLLKLHVISEDEQGEFQMYAPQGTAQGKITAVLIPYDFKNLSEIFKLENKLFLDNRADFEQNYNIRYEKTLRVVDMLTRIHNFTLLNGVTFLHSLIRDNLVTLNLPNEGAVQPTIDGPGVLDKQQSINYLLALATKLSLLPNTNYADIHRSNDDPDVKRFFIDYRSELLNSNFPDNNAFHYFGFNPDDGSVPGFDLFNKSIKRGTAYGDMIEAICKGSSYMFISIEDYVYHSTRQISGRTVFPAPQYGFGAFL